MATHQHRQPPLVVTPELMRAAWQARRRPSWPDSYEACMAEPLLRGLVKASAMGMARAQMDRQCQQATRAAATPPAQAASPRAALPPSSRTTQPTSARPLRQAALFDPKRLAAGDKPDDD